MKKFFFAYKKNLFILASCLIAGTLFVIAYHSTSAKNIDVCLTCHDDKNLYKEKDGTKISLYVNSELFKKSVHGNSDCTDCHTKYNPDEIPHTKIKVSVNCKSCHDDLKGFEGSVHVNVNCFGCHSKHEIVPAKELLKEEPNKCISCHNSKNVQKYNTSIHFKKNVGCEGCHASAHLMRKIPKEEVAVVCGKCHGSHEKNFNNSIHKMVLNNGNHQAPTCSDCHGSHEILTSKMSIESQSCLKCHLNEKLFPGKEKGSAIFVEQYRTSVHASIEKDGKEAAGCSDCHGNHEIQEPMDPRSSTSRTRLPETCGRCHKDIVDKYYTSAHGKALLNHSVAAPACVDCHSEHSIKAVRKADEFSKINQVEMCLNCHIKGKLPHKNYKGEEVLISNYKDSYHYAALKEGKLNAATCSDCHGAHEMNKFDDPDSRIFKANIEKTCGQSGCHTKQLGEYKGSIHEVSLNENSSSDAPTCTSCHGNHQILKKDEKSNRISNPKGLVQLCSDCHASVEIEEKYNLPAQRTESYLKSFHGLAVRGGSKIVANCESCHGYHNIRPSTDTLSTINKNNLPHTCGKCHPGTDKTLFLTKIHLTNESKESPWVFWITKFYTVMIIIVIGGMSFHNAIDYIKKVRRKTGITKSDLNS